jgi:hypothetical protein
MPRGKVAITKTKGTGNKKPSSYRVMVRKALQALTPADHPDTLVFDRKKIF